MASANGAVAPASSTLQRSWLDVPLFQSAFRSAYFLYKRLIEDPFLPLVRQHATLFRGGHILDIGANIGYTATVFAQVVSPGYKIFAFEPESRNVRCLQSTLRARGLSERVTVVPAAVGSKPGTTRLWLNPHHHADHRVLTDAFAHTFEDAPDAATVEVLSVDQFISTLRDRRVSFIKLDVQGYELAVCEGMTGTLEQNPSAAVAVEYYPKGIRALGFDPAALLSFFQQRGYAVHWLTRRHDLKPVAFDAIERGLGWRGYADLLFTPPTIHP